ncbi:hypothetical protein DYI20_10415 [Auritidibacter ignavus]|nr:hypothetical protein DYI20_10415 [Auritidibacter ignavus]
MDSPPGGVLKDHIGARVLPLRRHQRADPQARTEALGKAVTYQVRSGASVTNGVVARDADHQPRLAATRRVWSRP